MRSKWKGLNFNKFLYKKFLKASDFLSDYTFFKKFSKKIKLNKKIFFRNMTVLPNFGNRFYIYNGKQFFNVALTDFSYGYKFGEFSPTRKARSLKKTKKVSVKKK